MRIVNTLQIIHILDPFPDQSTLSNLNGLIEGKYVFQNAFFYQVSSTLKALEMILAPRDCLKRDESQIPTPPFFFFQEEKDQSFFILKRTIIT